MRTFNVVCILAIAGLSACSAEIESVDPIGGGTIEFGDLPGIPAEGTSPGTPTPPPEGPAAIPATDSSNAYFMFCQTENLEMIVDLSGLTFSDGLTTRELEGINLAYRAKVDTEDDFTFINGLENPSYTSISYGSTKQYRIYTYPDGYGTDQETKIEFQTSDFVTAQPSGYWEWASDAAEYVKNDCSFYQNNIYEGKYGWD